MSFLTNPQDSHFWITIALVVFLIVLWRAKVPGMMTKALDDVGARVQAQLDEAARLRSEAQSLLDEIKLRHEETARAAFIVHQNARHDGRTRFAKARSTASPGTIRFRSRQRSLSPHRPSRRRPRTVRPSLHC